MKAGLPRGLPTTVHPHGRGDNVPVICTQTNHHGSPPRAWGQCSGLGARSRVSRFTPTGVGTIICTTFRAPMKQVHPHGRGDNGMAQWRWVMVTGSPPRAWGQCPRSDGDAATARFTPTGVGTIQKRSAERLLRGRRFTPTGVGTMFGRTARRPAKSVHPHGRGDNVVATRGALVIHGSPPRAWGQSP